MTHYPSKKDFVINFNAQNEEEVEIEYDKELKRYLYHTSYAKILSEGLKLKDITCDSYDFSKYIITKELALAVKTALITGRPLLLKGEPGSGKTKLAFAIAVAMYGEDAFKHYFEWNIKSDSKAKDGGYIFDHVQRLRDATIKNEENIKPVDYVEIRSLGMAFLTSELIEKKGNNKDSKPSILLIDEIDKSDIDFPNDLLLELDEMLIKISELNGQESQIKANAKPLVFITSNDERSLPPAFLRRCIYYEIQLTQSLFNKIVYSKLGEIEKSLKAEFGLELTENAIKTKADVKKIIDTFTSLRDNIGSNTFSGKRSSTSELLDWVKMMQYTLSSDPTKPDLQTLLEQKYPDELSPYNFRSLILKQKLDT